MEQWEGGIRVNGWVSGGFLPEKVRGVSFILVSNCNKHRTKMMHPSCSRSLELDFLLLIKTP